MNTLSDFRPPYPSTVIIRHHLENLKKCSLSGLEGRADLLFYRYPLKGDLDPAWGDYLLLSLDAPPLTSEDVSRGLLLLDATWRYAEQMSRLFKNHPSHLRRSLPSHYRTAYPRKQTACLDPDRGLASVEALYSSHYILGRDINGLLDNYYWKDLFISINHLIL